MKQQLHFVTLGVRNLAEMSRFYQTQFGWTPLKEGDGITFFQLNGVILGLFPEAELAEDIGIPPGGEGFKRFTLAINFHSEAEVDDAFAELQARGVRVVKPPQKVFWGGYSGYVADPEGHCWELAFNPFLVLDAAGRTAGHT